MKVRKDYQDETARRLLGFSPEHRVLKIANDTLAMHNLVLAKEIDHMGITTTANELVACISHHNGLYSTKVIRAGHSEEADRNLQEIKRLSKQLAVEIEAKNDNEKSEWLSKKHLILTILGALAVGFASNYFTYWLNQQEIKKLENRVVESIGPTPQFTPIKKPDSPVMESSPKGP